MKINVMWPALRAWLLVGHGDDQKKVFNELCEIVEEAIELYRKDGRPLPPPTS
jgi:hypothetical protein